MLYSHERQMELIRTLFELYCHKLRSALNIYAMFFKQEEFQAEKEYRIVFKTAAESQIHYRIKEGFITPLISKSQPVLHFLCVRLQSPRKTMWTWQKEAWPSLPAPLAMMYRSYFPD